MIVLGFDQKKLLIEINHKFQNKLFYLRYQKTKKSDIYRTLNNQAKKIKLDSTENIETRSKRVFLFSKSIQERTHDDYLKDVSKSLKNNKSSRGVCGPSFFSNFINIVDQYLFDYMHVTIRGPLDDCLNLWLNSCYSSKDWYIGKY